VVNYAIERKKLVQELRESEQHYHELVEEGNDGIIIIQDGNIVFANPQIMKTTGYSLEQTLGKPFVGFVVPESRNLVMNRLKMRVSGETVSNKFDIEINDINGKKIPVEISTSVIKYHGRTAEMAIIRDITERKLAEATLRQSENKYRELTESISDVFFAMDNELRYTHWNKASEKLTGVTATDALGKKFFDIFPENEVTRSLQQIYLKAIRMQQSQHFISEYPGSQNLIHEITVYPSKDGISVFIKDITERRQLEKKANYLASFPELNPNPILELDQEGNLKYQNPAMKSIFPDFTTVGVNNPFLADWVQVVKELQNTNWSKEINRETKVGNEYYEQVISPVSKNQIRIYAKKSPIVSRQKMLCGRAKRNTG
jgi:PAS domain S-box-containing protein